jgi:FkbM family methyltransferase
LVEAAVCDTEGEVELSDGASSFTAHIRNVRSGGGRTRSVKATTMDRFAESAPAPDLVKIDVEGVELLTLA